MKNKLFKSVADEIGREILGKTTEIELVLTAFLAGGHVLIEDLPGMGKTSLAKSIARVFQLKFQRVQGSTDLLPSDILGVNIFNPSKSQFEFHEGPIFTEILLFDEMNRTPPKTQSALLQVMAEKQVTIDQTTFFLKPPFFVIGTQNPSSSEGTYRLPDSQMDRFSLRLSIGYPEREFERNILLGKTAMSTEDSFSRKEIVALQQEVNSVHVEPKIVDYVLDIVEKTRQAPQVVHGVSVRGSQEMVRLSMARAFFDGRDYVIPEDIRFLAPYVFSHRVLCYQNPDQQSQENFIRQITDQVRPPLA
jgi:MoxR-like ATPase